MKTTIEFFSPYFSWLYEEFAFRQQRNSSYSLRAYARDIGVSRTCVSDVLMCKRQLSLQNAKKIALKLELSKEVEEMFFRDLRGQTDLEKMKPEVLPSKIWEQIYPWYYFAILSLSKIPETPANPEYLSLRFGVEQDAIELALELLQKQGLLKIVEGRLKRTSPSIRSEAKTSPLALREHHKQFQRRAIEALDAIDPKERYFRTTTMAVDPSQLNRVSKLIDEFHEKIEHIMESGNTSEVYTLGVQLYPIRAMYKKRPLLEEEIKSTPEETESKLPLEPQVLEKSSI